MSQEQAIGLPDL